MEPRDELLSKARELERSDQTRAALELYLRAAPAGVAENAGPVWARIGELQLRLEEPEAAEESLSRAVELFVAAEQYNNAIAVSRQLLLARPANAAAHLRCGEISIRQGYRTFARTAVAEFARRASSEGRIPDATDAISNFIGSFPDEIELWRQWTDELLGLDRQDEAADGLRTLHDHMTAAGLDRAADHIADELRRIDPHAAPSADAAAGGEDPLRHASEEEEALPILDDPDSTREVADVASTADVEDVDADEPEIAPLAGLEPTHGGYDWPDSDAASAMDSDPLPLLDIAGEARTDPAPDGPAHSDEVEDADPLPLLGTEPDDAPGPERSNSEDIGLIPTSADSGDHPDFAQVSSEVEAPDQDEAARGADTPAFDLAVLIEDVRGISDREVEAADPATHYDLGLAYKEMGILDESRAHLRAALEGGHDPLAVLEVLGEVLIEQEQPEIADRLMRQAPRAAEGPHHDLIGLHYWLGRGAQELGDAPSARRFLGWVVEIDPRFRDASERLATLGEGF